MTPPKLASVPPAASQPSNTEPREPDPVPVELREVIALFAGPLAAITFPDVDATLLGRHAEALRAAARDLERARTLVAESQRVLDERTATLATTAHRGLAYARIYADAHPELELGRAVAAVAVAPLQPAVPTAPRRGRPPKTPRPELPFTAAATPSDAS